jgi:translation initiation factor 5B
MQLYEKGYRVANYWENYDPTYCISLVPTSAHTREGISDLLCCIAHYSQTSKSIQDKTKISDAFKCMVLGSQVISEHGTVLKCLLIDGSLKVKDAIVVLGEEGPILAHIIDLLTPYPQR